MTQYMMTDNVNQTLMIHDIFPLPWNQLEEAFLILLKETLEAARPSAAALHYGLWETTKKPNVILIQTVNMRGLRGLQTRV